MSSAVLIGLAILAARSGEISPRERELFDKTAGLYIQRESWTEPLAYLHGHFLMVPLHVAMYRNDEVWRDKYEEHFTRFVASDSSTWCKNPLSRAQYLYLATRYLALCAELDYDSPIADKLEPILTRELVKQWTSDEAIMWERPPFAGVRARLDYKMSLLSPRKSYFRAVTDEEFFHFAEAADLLRYRQHKGIRGSEDATLREMVSYAVRTVRLDGERTREGGWLYQVGVWRDHPDNNYSAQTEIRPGMAKGAKDDVTMDSSHFHRFSLFFKSLADASGGSDKKLFEDARAGLAQQLRKVVLKPPTSDFKAYRLTNYMNGWNGVYRFSSNAAVGEGKGYGPYQLSGTFLLGWWSFLGDSEVQSAYGEMARVFPLDETVLQTYLGPTYGPPPRAARSWYENGLAELLSSLASKVPASKQ